MSLCRRMKSRINYFSCGDEHTQQKELEEQAKKSRQTVTEPVRKRKQTKKHFPENPPGSSYREGETRTETEAVRKIHLPEEYAKKPVLRGRNSGNENSTKTRLPKKHAGKSAPERQNPYKNEGSTKKNTFRRNMHENETSTEKKIPGGTCQEVRIWKAETARQRKQYKKIPPGAMRRKVRGRNPPKHKKHTSRRNTGGSSHLKRGTRTNAEQFAKTPSRKTGKIKTDVNRF